MSAWRPTRRLLLAVGVLLILVTVGVVYSWKKAQCVRPCFGELIIAWDERLPERRYSVHVCVDDGCQDAEALGFETIVPAGGLYLEPRRFRYTRGIAFTPGPHDVVFRLVADDGTVVFDYEGTVEFEPNSCNPDICATARVKLDLGG